MNPLILWPTVVESANYVADTLNLRILRLILVEN